MSASVETKFEISPAGAGGVPWRLWLKQINAVFGLEIRKNFFGKRSILIYLLALLPILGSLALTIQPAKNVNSLTLEFAWMYDLLILRTVIFFGCAWIFMNLFRGELVDRSLHYYFLSPVRREVLVLGKYFSGLVTSATLFLIATVLSMLLLHLPFYADAGRFFFDGPGFSQLLAYAGVTLLACVGYGAFFLVVGLFFRNPIIPALVLYGWEFINFLLPPLLKKISVVHYLNSLLPVTLNQGPFAVIADPTPAWIAVPGLLIVTLLVLLAAGYRIRHMEIRYGND
jgi:ABC-type transport system involved in multi-copper enzyme maturation permease subunit